MISKAILLKGEETEGNINFPVVRNMLYVYIYTLSHFQFQQDIDMCITDSLLICCCYLARVSKIMISSPSLGEGRHIVHLIKIYQKSWSNDQCPGVQSLIKLILEQWKF